MSEPLHGTAGAYQAGCRCPACTQGWARIQNARNLSRRERLAADPSCVQHGLSSTYVNWGCRCRPCTQAHTIFCSRSRFKRRVAA